jgi:hypothetical protein
MESRTVKLFFATNTFEGSMLCPGKSKFSIDTNLAQQFEVAEHLPRAEHH